MDELEKAIAEVRRQYEVAKSSEMVKNPIGYALYYTWKENDQKWRAKQLKENNNGKTRFNG